MIVGVGKSWLLLRWVGEASKLVKGAVTMSTIGIDFKMKSIMIDGKRVKVQVVRLILFWLYLGITSLTLVARSGILPDKKDIEILQSHIIVIPMGYY